MPEALIMRPRDDFGTDPQPIPNDITISAEPEVLRAALPVFDNDQVAFYLTNTFWGGTARSFNIAPGGTISVNLSGLTADSLFFAEAALDAWTMVSGINFVSVLGFADITFGDSDTGGGAYSQSWVSGGTITSSTVEVETAWLTGDTGNLNSYSFQTYMHEIGHALGLGHGGDYNGWAGYAENGTGSNHYLNDSWQMSLMSYFSQTENSFVDASFAYIATPMIADILAIQSLYGTVGTLRTGDTVYGENSNAGFYYDTLDFSVMGFTIIDDGGTDWIRFKNEFADMTVDLSEESISSIGGETGNMLIARGTIIENFFAGSGNDFVAGNAVDNVILGGSGEDIIHGLDGNDNLHGNKGNDIIKGNDGDDLIKGNAGYDTLLGGKGNDTIYGGGGGDLIWGGIGDDRLIGGKGSDKLIGGAGADTFVFGPGSGKDKIRDFEIGIDTLEIAAGSWGSGIGDITVSVYDAVNGYIQLEFGTGDIVKLTGITDILDISGDFVFV